MTVGCPDRGRWDLMTSISLPRQRSTSVSPKRQSYGGRDASNNVFHYTESRETSLTDRHEQPGVRHKDTGGLNQYSKKGRRG